MFLIIILLALFLNKLTQQWNFPKEILIFTFSLQKTILYEGFITEPSWISIMFGYITQESFCLLVCFEKRWMHLAYCDIPLDVSGGEGKTNYVNYVFQTYIALIYNDVCYAHKDVQIIFRLNNFHTKAAFLNIVAKWNWSLP